MTRIKHIPAVAIIFAGLMVGLVVAWGCSSLHRDIEPLNEGDAGPIDDHDASADTADPDANVEPGDASQDAVVDPDGGDEDVAECEPGGVCGPCETGELICDNQQQLQCQNPIDLNSDPDHCGDCDRRCDDDGDGVESVECSDGQCIVQCDDPDHTYCADENTCFDLQSNLDHCGDCDRRCDDDGDGVESVECSEGQCIVQCDDPDHTYCADENACIDLQSNRDHCGGCGAACPGVGHQCVDGNCSGGG